MQISDRTIGEITNSSFIVKNLFTAEIRKLSNLLDSIIAQNDESHGMHKTPGFIYKGEYYKHTKATHLPPYGERLVLAMHLNDSMQLYHEQASKLILDVHMINQIVFRLVQGCKTEQDIRDVLPECLVAQDCEMRLSKYSRTRLAAWTLDNDSQGMNQYKKILPLMEYYSATHLLY